MNFFKNMYKGVVKLIFAVLIFLQPIHSSGQKDELEIEKVLLNCLISRYQEKGVDLEAELAKLEKYLVETGILKSTSGRSLYEFYKKVVLVNDIPVVLDTNKFSAVYRLNPNEYYSNDCLQEVARLESSKVGTSKYRLLNLKIQEVSRQGDITPSKVSEAILSVLSPSDFDMPYYRATGLLMIAWGSNPENEPEGMFEQPGVVDYSNSRAISIQTSDKNEIILNGELVSERCFETELAGFIRKNQSKHLVEISTDPNTSYGFYLRVQNAILKTYSSLREEKAIEFFNKSFSNLTVEEQGKVKQIYPIRIKE